MQPKIAFCKGEMKTLVDKPELSRLLQVVKIIQQLRSQVFPLSILNKEIYSTRPLLKVYLAAYQLKAPIAAI
ncbi:MAG TPA: hypothetical protein DC064_23540 [Cyanobacteria bacterium UBA9273]|nr:hypothetical protein [Cyanobacteria bacterium UBA9273]